MSDIVERLRSVAHPRGSYPWNLWCGEAADEIERLHARFCKSCRGFGEISQGPANYATCPECCGTGWAKDTKIYDAQMFQRKLHNEAVCEVRRLKAQLAAKDAVVEAARRRSISSCECSLCDAVRDLDDVLPDCGGE